MKRKFGFAAVLLSYFVFFSLSCSFQPSGDLVDQLNLDRGICVVLGDTDCEISLRLAETTDFTVYLQLETSQEVDIVRRLVDAKGLYGKRIWVGEGDFSHINLADDLADRLLVTGDAKGKVSESEALRVLCPQGKAFLGREVLVKPLPEGADDWSHPYHGPDNNPQSADRLARAPYLTKFMAEPYYAPLTQVAVASAGRVFKAFGNIAFHVREEPLLNSLVAFNGYNGTMLWRRKLNSGVMIHRNTLIATPDILYVGDDQSCKLIDTSSGQLLDEISPPNEVAGGTFWKWMALENGVLYALIGEDEQKNPIVRQGRQVHGWPWNPLSKGFNQPDHPWGFGQQLLAIDLDTKKVLWSHREEEKIDSRALCMKAGRIYIYRHGAYLACLNAERGEELWRHTSESTPGLFEALGPYLPRQGAMTNWRTTSYLKCSEKALYFAGPSVGKLLAVSAENGSILWQHPYSNFQLVLREDGLYAISGQYDKQPSFKFDPLTGEVLATIDTRRRACTRPNGSCDAIFFRAEGGSVRLDLASKSPQWVSPMRSQCHDGVTVANGLLYWWPSVCDCQNTLYGVTCLGPAGDFDFSQRATEAERLRVGPGDITKVANLKESGNDWPTFRANNVGTATTGTALPKDSTRLWWYSPDYSFTPTAPVTVGGLAFIGGSDGTVRALEMSTGNTRWKAFTGGSVFFPPTVWEGRLFVGSGDGWMYAFEAATGRLLWRFHAAPTNRIIPVYGSLMSTWPVASGVLVNDGVAYFAAGIVNYDGTHVYALDAKTGSIVWQNNTSGHLESEARTGVSVQGHLLIDDGKLYLAGGTSVSPAVYDLRDGSCLNDPTVLRTPGSTAIRGQELYKLGDNVIVSGKPLYGDPDHPVFDPSVDNKVLHTSADRRDIVWVNNQKLMAFQPIDNRALNSGVKDPPNAPSFLVMWGKLAVKDKPLWEHTFNGSVAFARCKNAVLLAGAGSPGAALVDAVDIESGKRYWRRPKLLPGAPVPWGLAVDSEGRAVVVLEDGAVVCFGSAK